MGRGKSKPKKTTPKRRPAKPKKRKMPEGLRRWNQVRSYLSGQNKKAGKKFNGVELNALVKSFLGEYKFQDFTQRDIETYVSTEVPDFYSNALDVPQSKLGPFKYFQINEAIGDLPTGLLVVIDANGFGQLDIKTGGYDYHNSRLRDVVENIRLEAENGSKGYNFHGFVVKNDRPNREKKHEPEYLVLFILYVNGVPVVDTAGISPIPVEEHEDYESESTDDLEAIKSRATEKHEKNVEKRKKKAAAKTESKSEKERMMELEIEKLKQQNLKADKILKLIEAGYTKAEIKAMGL